MGLLDFLKDIDIKDKPGDFWNLIDDPVKNVLKASDRPRGFFAASFSGASPIQGFLYPEAFPGRETAPAQAVGNLPYIGNNAQKITGMALDVGLDPLTYIPAVGLATKAKFLRPLLSPVAGPNAGATRRVTAELATGFAARSGAEVAGETFADTPFRTPAALIGGLAGGVAAGRALGAKNVAASKANILEEQLNEDIPHILDNIPPTIKKYDIVNNRGGRMAPESGERYFNSLEEAQATADQFNNTYKSNYYMQEKYPNNELFYNVKEIETPNPYAPEFQYKERDIPIRLDNDTKIIERGQLVFSNKETRRFDVDEKLVDVDMLVQENRYNWEQSRNTGPEARTTTRFVADWLGSPSTSRGELETSIKNDQELARTIYDAGGNLRNALHEANPDGFVNLYRGESRVREGIATPQFEKDQLVQSYSSWPHGARGFTHALDNPDFPLGYNPEKVLIKQQVPIDDIVIAPYGSSYDHEHELIVLDRKQLTDEQYTNLTGHPKGEFATGLSDEELERLRETERQIKYLTSELQQPDLNPELGPIFRNEIIKLSKEHNGLQLKQTELEGGIKTRNALLAGDEQEALDTIPSTLEGIEVIPVDRTNINAGNELVEALVGAPTTPVTGRNPLVPKDTPTGGAAGQEQFHKILTGKGINTKIAKNLESIPMRDRQAVSDVIVNEMGVKGVDAELLDLVITGYHTMGKTDPSFAAKLNNLFRGMWATGDGSWFGIQGLLSIPRLIAGGDFRDAYDTLTLPIMVLGGNQTAMTKWLKRTMETVPEGAPSIKQAVEEGKLHLSFLQGNVDLSFTAFDRLPFFKPDAAFTAAGDIARISMFYNEWARYGTKGGDGAMVEIARAVNRATGVAESPFGGQIGAFALFAPRFFQSQIEVVVKAVSDGGIEGNLARHQLLTMIGAGTALTFAANYARGYSPMGVDLDEVEGDNPFEKALNTVLDPNFMRIKNIAGNDISVFGPWDSLVKLIAHVGMGDLGYARTKFGPLFSLAINLVYGKNFINQDIENNPWEVGRELLKQGNEIRQGDFSLADMEPGTKNLIKSLVLPFAWQETTSFDPREVFTDPTSYLNFFGVKNTPLSRSERIEVNMANLGLDPDDPLDRRQFLTDYPEYRPQATEEDKTALEYRNDIQSRRDLNENGTRDGSIKLVEFRENRKILSRELRNKQEVLFRNREDFKDDTPQKQWISSYFALFDQAQDPITKDIVGETFDKLESQWIQSNGPEALDYLQRYMQIGKGEIEAQYLNDMSELDELGYFDAKKYTPYVYEQTKLTDDQINDYRNEVSAARSVNENLAKMSFKSAMYIVLGEELTVDQINGLDLAGKDAYVNPQIEELKNLQPHLFQWFNQNATWETYNTAKGTSVELPSPSLVDPKKKLPSLSDLAR